MSMKNYRSRGKARALLNLLSDPAVIIAGKGNFPMVNGTFEEVTGTRRKELVGNPVFKLNTVTTESKAVHVENLEKKMQEAPSKPYEVCFTDKTGETRFVEEKEKEREIKSEVGEISSIFDGIGDILFVMDPERHLIRVNKSACEVFKKNPEELLGKHCYEIVHGTDKPWPNCPVEKMLRTRQTVSEEVNDPNIGIPLLVTASPILDKRGEIIQCIHIAKDISKIKFAEMEMHIAANLFDAASDSILMHELEGRLVYFNEAAYKTRGYTRDEFQGLSVQDLEAPDNPRYFGSLVRELLDKGEATFEAVNLRKDKTVMPVEIHSKVIESDGRKLVLSVARDITERRRMETSLRESEEKLRSIIENSSDQIFMLDRDCRFLLVNKTAAGLFGISPQEMVGRSISEIFPETIAAQFSINIKNVFDTGKRLLMDEKMVAKGRELYSSTSLNPVRDCRGRVIAVTGIVRDITERKRSEEELQKAEEKFRLIFEGASDGILAADTKTRRFAFANPRICEITGYSLEELLKLNVNDIHPEKDLPHVIDKFTKQLLGKTTLALNIPVLRKDEGVVYCDVNSKLMRIGGQEYLVGFFRDVTERKKAEKALQESEKRFRAIFEGANDGILLADVKTKRFFLANPRICEMTGYSSEELLKLGVGDIHHKKDLPYVIDIFTKQTQGKLALSKDIPVLRKDERVVYCEISARSTKIGNQEYLVGFFRDVTERKKAEEVLRESEESFRSLIDSMDDLVFVLGFDGIFKNYHQPSHSKELYVAPEEFIGKHLQDVIPPNVAELCQAAMKRIEDSGETQEFDYYMEMNGEKSWYSARLSPAIDKSGRKTSVTTVIRNITERKKAEQAVSASLKRYQSFIEVTGELGWTTNAAGEVEEDVPSFRNFTGQTYDEVKGWGWTKAVHPDDLEHAMRAWQAAVAAKTKYEVEYRVRRCDGVYRNFMARGAPILDEDGKIREWVGTCIDITDRKEAEDALNRTMDELVRVNEKLGVVGSLTRHDVRNKLCAITGNAFLLKKKHADQPDITEGIGKMEQATKEIEKILDFAKIYEQLGVEELTYVNLEEKLNEATSLFSGPLPKIISECQGLTVLADSFLRQLFYNFIDNTRKYGEKTTTIRVTCEKADQGSLKLVYEDNGVGVPFENKASLFKEGFSTGGSTGFGLFLSKKMMDVYGWEIKENGEPGKGAKFTITIPRLNKNGQENFQIAAKYDPKRTLEHNIHFVISNSEEIYSHSSNNDVAPIRLKKGGDSGIAN